MIDIVTRSWNNVLENIIIKSFRLTGSHGIKKSMLSFIFLSIGKFNVFDTNFGLIILFFQLVINNQSKPCNIFSIE